MGNRGVKVKRRSVWEIRENAMKLRELLDIGPGAVDVLKLLEHKLHELGVDFQVVEVEELSQDEGLCEPNEDIIKIRQDVYEALSYGDARARFTAVHEIGHLVMHTNVQLARSSVQYHHWKEDSEWQADTFSAEFLMPADEVAEHCSSELDIQYRFNVSKQAAEIRWRELKREGVVKMKRAEGLLL